MRKKLIFRLLYFDFFISIVPLTFINLGIYLLFSKYDIKYSLLLTILVNLIGFSVLNSISLYLKTKVALKPMNQIIESLHHFKEKSQYETIIDIDYYEGQVLNNTINQFVRNIQEKEREALRSKNLKEMGEMSSIIAHEIRNPLQTIRGSFQLLKSKPGDVDLVNRFSPVIISELDRMNKIIESFLDYSRIPSLNFDSVKLKSLIDELLLLKSSNFKEKQICFINQVEDVTVRTDREKLYQVILNIICNAEEAIGTEGTIQLYTSQSDCYTLLHIKDDGCGMSQQVYEKFAKLFYSTKESGTGLGIPTSIKLMEQLGGQIEFKTKENIGTEVIISIPVHSTNSQE